MLEKYNKLRLQRYIIGLCFIALGGLILVGLGLGFVFEIQENSYGRPNDLLPLARALGYPMSLTSFVYLLGGCFGLYGGFMFLDRTFSPHYWSSLIAIMITIYNVIQEIGQVITNPYPDTHELDIVLGTLAAAVFWVIIHIIYRDRTWRFPF